MNRSGVIVGNLVPFVVGKTLTCNWQWIFQLSRDSREGILKYEHKYRCLHFKDANHVTQTINMMTTVVFKVQGFIF